MCDFQCTVGWGITAGVAGLMLSIICCKTLCEFLLELNQSVTTPAPVRIHSPTVIEMPILIRIYIPQLQSQQVDIQQKNSFEPLPV